MIPAFGFASATYTIVSNTIGQNKTGEVMQLIKKIIILSLLSSIVLLQFNLFFPEFIISVYTDNPSLINATIPTLYIITGSLVLIPISITLFCGVSGTGNTRVSLIIEIATIVIYLISAYVLAVNMNMPVEIVWCTEFIYLGVLGILSFGYLKRGKWKKIKV
ncbi:MAG: MATE family efflux transporter [Bacteroidota bacterium]